jgi:hypothetical protein
MEPPRSLFNFPHEIIAKILEEIMEDLVDSIIARQYEDSRNFYPIEILKQYRSLLLTCTTFHTIVRRLTPVISLTTAVDLDKIYLWRGDAIDNPVLDRPYKDVQTFGSYNGFLSVLQIVSLRRYILFHKGTNVFKLIRRHGRFYLNPGYRLHDLFEISKIPDPQFLLLLGPFFEARRQICTPRSPPHELLNRCHQIFDVGECASVLQDDGSKKLRSVTSWKCRNDEILSGSNISEDVKEWWVWGESRWENLYFVGYAGMNAWVLEVRTRTLYSNGLGPTTRIKKRKGSGTPHEEQVYDSRVSFG